MFVKWKSKNNSSYEYVSLQDATKLCSYSQEYLSLRARQGKLKALKLGRNWVTKKEWLKEYVGKAEEYNNYINGRIAAKQAISPSAPDNLPIEKFRLDLSLRNLRPVFAFALVFILLTAGGVFALRQAQGNPELVEWIGKESLLKTYHDVSPYIKEVGRAGDLVMEDYRQSFAAVSKDIGNMADDAFVAAVHYRNGLTSVSGIVGDYGNWLKENYSTADNLISQQVVRGVRGISQKYGVVDEFIDKWTEQQIVKAVGVYSSADKFVSRQITQSVNQIPRTVLGISKDVMERYFVVSDFVKEKVLSFGNNFFDGYLVVKDGYFVADNFVEQKIVQLTRTVLVSYYAVGNALEKKVLEIVQGTAENFKEGVEMTLVEGREIREKITETWQLAKNFIVSTKTKISNSIKENYQLVTQPWKDIASVSDKFREGFEKLKTEMEILDKEPLVIKSIEVSKVVEKEKEIIREKETIQQITKIDDEALKQVRESIAYLETEIGKRLYAPGGVVSQTIYMTEPVSSPKIYQENGEIVLQTLGSGNVILTAATGLQLYGQQVVIDSSSILNPMIYLADNTKIDGTLTAGNTSVGTLTAGTTGISGNLTLTGDLALTGATGLTASSTSVALSITQSGTGDILNLFDGSTEVFTVLDGGNVGIATTSPSYQFAVQGRSYFSATTTIASDLVVSGAMKNTATKIVAASDTPNRDARADYVADGTADEVEIQAAIDSLPSSGGSVVLLEGTFNISSPIYTPTSKPLMLIGQGMGEEPGGVKQGTMLRLSNGANSSMIVVNNTAHTYFLTIKNLTLNGNKNNQTATSYGIEFKRYISDIVLENIYIFGFYSDAIHVAPTTDFWNLWLDSVLIENNSGWGLYLDNSANVDLNNVFINNSWFYRDTEGEIFAKNLEKKYWSPSSLLISDTMFASRKHAIQLQGSKNLKIVGNSIRDRSLIAANTYDAILLEDSNSTTNEDIIIQGNEISGGADQFRYGINMSSTTRSIVTNNQISGFGSHGIVLASSSDNIISQNIIYDNGKAAAATYDGIFVDDNSDYNNIQANVIRKGSGNTHRYGIRINSSDSDGNRIINNDLRQAGGTANLSDAGTLTEIIGNRTSDAGGQEITISGSATALTVTQSGTGDILNLFDGSTEVFTVLDGGNVGIGTTNPSSKLTVFGGDLTVGGGDATTTITNGQIALDYGISAATGTYSGLITATGGLISSASSTFATDLNISNNATTTGYFSAGGTLFVNQEKGRVGIATSTPRYTLDIWGDLAIGTSTDTNTPVLYVESGNGGRVGIGTTTLVGLLTVGTTTPALVVAQNGFVGIASSTPSDTFAVQGNILGVGNIVISGTIETGQGATELYAMNQPVQTTDNVTFANLTLTYGLTSATGTYSGLITATGGFVSSASSTILGNFSVEGDATTTGNFAAGSTLYVDQSNSRVGIATTTPRYKLDIWGDMAVGTTTATTSDGISVPLLYVDSGNGAGKIGIATSTPRYSLDVWGSLAIGTTTSPIFFADTGLTGAPGITVGADMSLGSIQVASSSGVITLVDMVVESSAAAGTMESYDIQIDSNSLLTIYAESDGAGGIRNQAVGIGTSTPTFGFEIAASTTQGYFGISPGSGNASGQLFTVSGSGNIGIGTSTPTGLLTVATSTGPTLLYVDRVSGNVGIGTDNPTSTLSVYGDIGQRGDIIHADIAEDYPVSDDAGAGDVVEFDPRSPWAVRKSTTAYSKYLAGVISTAPGYRIYADNPDWKPIALAGRVPVKVSLENGPIEIGDPLTSSDIPGVAMKATGPGKILGYALEPFEEVAPPAGGATSTGLIMAFINLNERGSGDLTVQQNSDGKIEVKAFVADNLTTIFSIDEEGAMVVGKLKTQELCVGSVCVTEEDFMRVFGDATPDTGAVCQNGANRPCGTEVGACQIGVEICEPIDTAQGRQFVWGECIGAAFPTDEICDEVDNDCDGETDEGDTCLGAGEVVPPAGGPTSTEPIIEPDISTSTDSIATTTEEII